MTVSSSINRVTYAGNGATTNFAVNFYFLENSHLQVILVAANGLETVQTLTTNYTVTGAGNEAGGSITMLVAPPTGTQLIIVRSVPATQETDYIANDPFPAESHERALDKLTMLAQQNKSDADRAIKFPTGDSTAINNVLQPAGTRATKLLGFAANGSVTTSNKTIAAVDAAVDNLENLIISAPQGNAVLVRYDPDGSDAIATNVQAKLRESVSVKDFGAIGDGITNDTEAFQKAAAYINAQSGGKLVIPAGTYIVGKQNFAGQTGLGYAYQGENVLVIRDCTEPVVVEAQGAKLKIADGLRFGSFDPVTGNIYNPPSMPFTDSNFRGQIGITIGFLNNKNISLIGSLEIDGNIDNAIVGGTWGDAGRQLIAYGVWVFNNDQCYIENVWSHHHCLDGFASGYSGLTSEASVNYPLTLMNCVAENNARQGWSMVGGRGVTAINCKFNNTGKDIPFSSSPGAGVDIEAEGTWIRDVVLIDCEMSNNSGAGLVADSGNSASVTCIRCKFIGTTNASLWSLKPRMSFYDCLIVGTNFNAFGDANNPDNANKFFNCRFTDEIIYSPTGAVYTNNFVINIDNRPNVLFDNCTIIATQTKLFNIKFGILRNCTAIMRTDTLSNRDFFAISWNSRLENNTIIDEMVSPPTDGYFLSQTGENFIGRNQIISPANKLKWISWSVGAGGFASYYGQNNPNQFPVRFLAIHKDGRSNAYAGIVRVYADSAAPTTGDWIRGDKVINDTPTVGQPKGWICTVSGTPGTWVSEGNL